MTESVLATLDQLRQIQSICQRLGADPVEDRRSLVKAALDGWCPPLLAGMSGLTRSEADRVNAYYTKPKGTR